MKIKSNDIESIRQINTAMVLDKLRHAEMLLSRPQVASMLDLSKVTISNIVRELSDQGLVMDAGLGIPDKRGGRKPLLIDLDRSRRKVLAAHISHHCLELVLGDISGREVKHLVAEPQKQNLHHLLLTMINDILLSTNTPQDAVVGLAISVYGQKGETFSPNSGSSSLEEELSKKLSFPVMRVEPFEARAFSECWYGTNRKPSFLYVDLSHELNCVIVDNGRLSSFRPRLGDCILSACPYGDQDTGEPLLVRSLISGTALINKAEKLLGREMDIEKLCEMARQDEAIPIELFKEFGYWLGCALSLCINMTDSMLVVAGGELCSAWQYFQDGLSLGLERHVQEERQKNTVIKALDGDRQNSLKGALAMALDNWIFHTELL